MDNLPDTDASKTHSNIILIYQYTEKEIEGFNKSIDNLVSKLTAAIGFSGVLLKFISDLPSTHAWIRVIGSILLGISIILCGLGLIARDGGDTIRARALLRQDDPCYYRMDEEEYRLRIIRQWHKHIESLERLLDTRRRFLNGSIIILLIVGILYAIDILA